jgi:hypothetical protein
MPSSFRGRSKFGAVKTVVDGLRFDSKKEARRWSELKALEQAKMITGLERQVSIPIYVSGVKVCTYRADFCYQQDGEHVVEDAKGFETDVFKLKWKMVKLLYPQWRFVLS